MSDEIVIVVQRAVHLSVRQPSDFVERAFLRLMFQQPRDSMRDHFRIDVKIILPLVEARLLEDSGAEGGEPNTRIRLIPVASEQRERTVGIHEGQLPLIANVHVVETLLLLLSIPLIYPSHVERRVHVGSKAEHVLLGRVHWQIYQAAGVYRHRWENWPDDVTDKCDGGFVRAENVVTILVVGNNWSLRDVYVHVLEDVGAIAQIQEDRLMTVLRQSVGFHVERSRDRVLTNESAGVNVNRNVAESHRDNGQVNLSGVLRRDPNEELMLSEGGPWIVGLNDAVLLHVNELVVPRVGQHHCRFNVVLHVIEHRHSDSHLLSLSTARRHFHVDEERQHPSVLQGLGQHSESPGGAHTESRDHPVNGPPRHVNVEYVPAVRSNVDVLPQPHVLVLSLNSAETPFPEVRNVRGVYLRATRLVRAVLAIENPVAFLFNSVTLAVQALAVTLRAIAKLVATMDVGVRENHQADVLEGAIWVNAESRGGIVNELVRIAVVVQPGVLVGAVSLLAKVRHLLNDVCVGQLVASLHREERTIDPRQGDVSTWLAVNCHLHVLAGPRLFVVD